MLIFICFFSHNMYKLILCDFYCCHNTQNNIIIFLFILWLNFKLQISKTREIYIFYFDSAPEDHGNNKEK